MLGVSIRFPLRGSAVILGLALALVAGDAWAAAGPSMDVETLAGGSGGPPARAIEQWEDQNPWSYGTDAIFGLTRGLPGEGVDGAALIALYFLTVPLDLVQAPAALIGGLWGS